MYICIYVYIYICMYICMYTYIYGPSGLGTKDLLGPVDRVRQAVQQPQRLRTDTHGRPLLRRSVRLPCHAPPHGRGRAACALEHACAAPVRAIACKHVHPSAQLACKHPPRARNGARQNARARSGWETGSSSVKRANACEATKRLAGGCVVSDLH